MAAVCSSKTEAVISQPWIPWRNLVCSSPSLSLPFHPTPSTRPPQPARGLVNAISKRICDILSPENVFGDNKTLSMYESCSCQKKVVDDFKPVKEEVPVCLTSPYSPTSSTDLIQGWRRLQFGGSLSLSLVGAAQFNNELLYITDMQQCETDS